MAGRITNRTDFNGRTTTFIHDVMNRLVEKRPDAAFAAAPVQFGYNELGLRTNMVDASGVTTFEYDNRNRLVRKATPQGALTYAYNPNGQVTNIASLNANGVMLDYSYDALNRLSEVHDPHAGHTTYTYDDVGNLRGFTYPNGVNHFYEYSALNRLTNLNVSIGLSGIANYAYTLAPSGHRTGAVESRVINPLNPQVTTLTRLYGYDRTYRLTNETIGGTSYATPSTLDYSYDRVGNRLQLVSTEPGIVSQLSAYDPNDRLLSDTSDNNGNTLTAPGFAQAQPDQYDYENRLIRRTENGKTIVIVYDGDGQRVRKTVTTATNTVTTHFLVDIVNPTGYAQVLEEITTDTANPQLLTPQVTRVYAYGHDLISQLFINPSTQTPFAISYYGYDGHGNTRLLTHSNATVTDTCDYDAFGNLIARTGTTPNLYLFTGEQYDSDLGLYFLRARYQNTQTGRFWTMDEFQGHGAEPMSLHKFLYANADPVNRTDPSGFVSSFIFGRAVHQEIGLHFVAGSPATRLSDRTMGTILGFVSEKFLAKRPDLIDLGTHELYEIKTTLEYPEGLLRLQFYLFVLRNLDPLSGWREGVSYVPPPRIPLIGGAFAIVNPPIFGVITYEVIDPVTLVALAAAQTTKVFSQLAARLSQMGLAQIRTSITQTAYTRM